MINKKILSISIAAYNVGDYLRDTLNSLIVSDYYMNKMEIFIVNDGSKDDTKKIAEEFVEKYPDSIILIDKDNGGWGSTINSSIKTATGKYFKILDGDDLFDTNNLEKYIEYLENTEQDLIVTPFESFSDVDGQPIKLYRYDDIFNIDNYNFINIYSSYDMSMHSCTVKTKILKENNILLLENCFYTDNEFMVKLYSYVRSIGYFSSRIYLYRLARDGQSISLDGIRKHHAEHLELIKSLLDFVDNLTTDNYIIDKLNHRLANLVTLHYIILWKLKPSKEHKNLLKYFDNYIKRYENIYRLSNKKYIKTQRLLRFNGYKLFCYIITKRV